MKTRLTLHFHKNLRKLMYITVTILLLLSFCIIVFAASDYDRAFIQNDITIKYPAQSPYKDKYGFPYFSACTSKNNQARFVNGTNPHQGTDLNIIVGELIYPIYDGEVVFVNKDISSQTGKIVVKSEIEKEKFIYIEYMHIVPIDGLETGSYVYTSIAIASIDENKRYDCHLHIGQVDESMSLHLPMYYLYPNIAYWNNGSDLDVFSHPKYDENSGEFQITAYVSSDTENTSYYAGYGKFPMQYLTLFYNLNDSGWKQVKIYDNEDFTYKFNIHNISGAKKGDTIKYYLTASRDNNSSLDTTFNNAPYNISYYPAFYAHPQASLNETQADEICLSITVK